MRGRVDPAIRPHTRHHAADGRHLPAPPRHVARFEPVEAGVCIVGPRLLRQQHREAVPGRQGAPARALGEAGGMLRAAMQHHHQRRAGRQARWHEPQHPQLAWIVAECDDLFEHSVGSMARRRHHAGPGLPQLRKLREVHAQFWKAGDVHAREHGALQHTAQPCDAWCLARFRLAWTRHHAHDGRHVTATSQSRRRAVFPSSSAASCPASCSASR